MNKQTQFTPYSKDVLPKGFSYPESYLKLAKDTSSIKYDDEYPFPWWFENAKRSINDCMELHERMTGQKGLLVFARHGDWGAFFNTYDKTGNPEVIVYDLGAVDTGGDTITNFDEWLELAIKDAW